MTIMINNWIPITRQLPKEGEVVETKVANPDRNIQDLKYVPPHWYFPDMSMYVYYEPTHWRYKKDKP